MVNVGCGLPRTVARSRSHGFCLRNRTSIGSLDPGAPGGALLLQDALTRLTPSPGSKGRVEKPRPRRPRAGRSFPNSPGGLRGSLRDRRPIQEASDRRQPWRVSTSARAYAARGVTSAAQRRQAPRWSIRGSTESSLLRERPNSGTVALASHHWPWSSRPRSSSAPSRSTPVRPRKVAPQLSPARQPASISCSRNSPYVCAK